MTKKYTVQAGVLVLGLVIGFFAGSIDKDATERKGIQSGHSMGGLHAGQDIDQHFITQMIPHHEGAIEMAKVALARSKRPEVISLAKGIMEAQERENSQMRAWYQAWYGSAPSSAGGMMHMQGMEGDIGKLKSVSADQFDREFVEQMIPHHEMAIMMAQMLQGATKRQEMQSLADQIITSQTREIKMMRTWLQSW